MSETGKHFFKVFASALLIWLACPASAQCTNKPFAPCKLYEAADAVFVGTVKDIGYSEPVEEVMGLSKKTLRDKMILLTIKESFKGDTEKQTEILITTPQIQKRSPSGEMIFEKHVYPDCPFDEFVQGEIYLVFARRNTSDRKSIFFADQATPFAEADEAVKYFRNRKADSLNAMLYGQIVRKMRPLGYDLGEMSKRPFRNIKVEAQSATQRFVTNTDEKGNYLFSDIPPDDYSIKSDLPEQLEVENKTQKISLAAKSCKEHNIFALTMGEISGTVLNHEGKPKSVEVELVVATEAKNPKSRKFVVSSDWQTGKFEFKNIPPAQYLLGVNLGKLCRQEVDHGRVLSFYFSCRPSTYYPGVSEVAQATLITLTEGDQLKDFDFRLAQPFLTRTISGIAYLPDGKPAANAEISLMIFQGESVEFGGFTKTDEYGRFSIRAYNDLKSWISANVKIKGKDWHSEPVDLSKDNEVNGIKLALSSSGKFCSLCYNKYWKRKGTPPQ